MFLDQEKRIIDKEAVARRHMSIIDNMLTFGEKALAILNERLDTEHAPSQAQAQSLTSKVGDQQRDTPEPKAQHESTLARPLDVGYLGSSALCYQARSLYKEGPDTDPSYLSLRDIFYTGNLICKLLERVIRLHKNEALSFMNEMKVHELDDTAIQEMRYMLRRFPREFYERMKVEMPDLFRELMANGVYQDVHGNNPANAAVQARGAAEGQPSADSHESSAATQTAEDTGSSAKRRYTTSFEAKGRAKIASLSDSQLDPKAKKEIEKGLRKFVFNTKKEYMWRTGKYWHLPKVVEWSQRASGFLDSVGIGRTSGPNTKPPPDSIDPQAKPPPVPDPNPENFPWEVTHEELQGADICEKGEASPVASP